MKEVIRQAHRWLGLIFTLIVIANFVAIALVGEPPEWLTYLPLAPLAVMIPSGVYLFFAGARSGGGSR